MDDHLAESNVNRAYGLAATCVAIFTFILIFLYPRSVNGEANPFLFQATLMVMAATTFSCVFAAFHYYGASLAGQLDDTDRAVYARRADRFWLVGYSLLFLAPSLVLLTVNLLVPGAVWLALWLVYIGFVARYFPRVRSM